MKILISKKFLNKIISSFKSVYLPSSGRNNLGIITVRHQGGGIKRRWYNIDLFRRINDFGIILKVIKTSFRNSYLGIILYKNGLSSSIIFTDKTNLNKFLYSGSLPSKNLLISVGTSLPLIYMGLFNIVSCVELKPYKGIQLLRSAGMNGIINSKINNKISLKFLNGNIVLLSDLCMCSYGIVSNPNYRYLKLKKAGYNRVLGIRPTVRGVAMNPVDHPHGGGNGRKSGLVTPKGPWGWFTKSSRKV